MGLGKNNLTDLEREWIEPTKGIYKFYDVGKNKSKDE